MVRTGAVALWMVLLGCAPAECFEPRDVDATECAQVDRFTTLRFVAGELNPDVAELCRAKCVDVNGVLQVGSLPLKQVPLMSKIRKITSLEVAVDGVEDLSGLEGVAEILSLELRAYAGSESFHSMNGLNAKIQALVVDKLLGLKSLDGADLSELAAFEALGGGIESVDLRSTKLEVFRADKSGLRSVALPGTSMTHLEVIGNRYLESISWESGTRVKSTTYIWQNPVLSSCAVARLQVATGPAFFESVGDNGPCP